MDVMMLGGWLFIGFAQFIDYLTKKPNKEGTSWQSYWICWLVLICELVADIFQKTG